MSGFAPKFADFQAVISNYNGDEWSEPTKQALVDYVSQGGALVIIHAANNSFPKWAAYNEMIGLGGWGGRTEKDGPYLRLRGATWIRDMTRQANVMLHCKQLL